MRNFAFPIQLRACLFALRGLISRLLYSLRYVVGCACAVSIGIDIRFAHCRRLAPPVRWLLVICVCFPPISYASSPPSNDVHICEVLDYEDIRARDSLYAATKQALNLNVGEPRTVRMIYFLPNDRPFQQEVVDSMKVTIRQIQTFYADQMEAHGYGRKTFRFETDAQGDPVVHRVDGRHPDSYYIDNGGYWQEIREKFDTRGNNVYVIVWDNSVGHINGAAGVGGGGRDGGGVTVTARFLHWTTVAHELGHAFGLSHDFRDGNYIMSYGPTTIEDQLSACHAEFLSVHPYFDPDIPDEETPGPKIELISPNTYPTGSTSVPVRLKVSDPDGLHQVLLFVNSRGGFAGGSYEVKACRGLSGEKDAVVQFDYDGVTPSDGSTSLSDPLVHPIYVEVVDSFGNVGSIDNLNLFDVSTQRDPIATLDGTQFVSFSPDGTTLATGSRTVAEVELWDIATRTNIATLKGHSDRVISVSFSPDGTILASGSEDRTVKLWDVATRKNIATLEGHVSNNSLRDGVNSVAFSPDGKMLASGSHDLTVKLWDVSKKTTIATLEGHGSNINGGVNSVAFSPDGKILASGAYDQTVKLWDIATGQNIATLGHGINSFVHSVAFSPDGATLASGTGGGVELWDVATRNEIATLISTGGITSVSFSPDGTTLASGSFSNAIEFWDVATRSKFATLIGHTASVNSVAFSSDGSILASTSWDRTVKLWDMSEWLRPRPSGLMKVSGDTQQGTAGAKLTSPLVVELRDQYGSALPLQGIPVIFTVTEGNGKLGGRFTVENTVTDANGRAQIALTLGPNLGTNTVEVSIGGRVMVTFNAVGVGAPITPIRGGNYQGWHLPDGAIARLGKGAISWGDRAVAFSPDGQRLAVASSIGIWLYDVATFRELELSLTPMRYSEPRGVAFSPDGTILASWGHGIKLWDVVTRTEIATLDMNFIFYSVSFSPDGTMLVSGSSDGTVNLWDVATGTNIATLKGHSGNVHSVSFSPDGEILASGSWDDTVNLWDVATGTNIATLEGHSGNVHSVSFSPDGTILASGSENKTVNLWDVATGANIATLKGHSDRINSVSLSPDGEILASGSSDGTVKLWDVATGTNIATLEGHSGHVHSVSFSPDGTMLVSGSSDGTVKLWDVATQNNATLEGHSNRINSVSFSPDGTMLASGSENSTVNLWDVATGANIATLTGHSYRINSVSFSPDGTILASGGHGIKLWDVVTRTKIATLVMNFTFDSVSFSPDGTILASGGHGIKLWDVVTRTKIATLDMNFIFYSVSFSPDGTMLASGSENSTVKLWDVATGTNIATLKGHSGRINSVSFSPDGEILASGSGSSDGTGTVKLWDVATGTNIATLEGHSGNVLSVSFSPDGEILASGFGRTVKLWDVATGTNIATLEGHWSLVTSVSFSPDGTTLASSSWDGTILLWDMSLYISSISDFDGDGTVGFPDFLLFVEQFGFSREDEAYQARFDLDGDGMIGFSDFLIFVNSFGKKVS